MLYSEAFAMSGPDESIAVLRKRVEQQEQELESAVRSLGMVARESLTPTNWIRERPVASLTGALVLGWWLGRPRSSRSRRTYSRGT
jgi:hypothetical protein